LHFPSSESGVCVGDIVLLETESEALRFRSRQKRENLLLRQHYARQKLLCANVSHLYILSGPDTLLQLEFIDRLLCAAFDQEIPCTLVANKIDVRPEYDRALNIYESLGIAVIPMSAKTGAGLSTLCDSLARSSGSLVTLTGISGVGKSTLLNQLFQSDLQITSNVSKKSGQGRQTTSQSRAHFHPELNIYIVDLPGVQQFGLHHLGRSTILNQFREFAGYHCEYQDCAHIGELQCAVKDAVNAGTIAQSRYSSYVKFIREYEQYAKEYS
jgi:ribosome biogenesis GTPase